MAFKNDVLLRVLEYDSYQTKDGRVIDQIVLGDIERCIRYNFRIPKGMPKPKVGEMVEVSIDLRDYNGRLYPVLAKVE